MPEGLGLAREYHRNLPARIREYLRQTRGLSDAVIDRRLLGWNGSRITIPVFGRDGQFEFFKLAKDPEDKTDSPKVLAAPGAHAELYGWEQVLTQAKQAKIPVILVDRGVTVSDNSLYTTLIASDFVEEGRRAGEVDGRRGEGRSAPAKVSRERGTRHPAAGAAGGVPQRLPMFSSQHCLWIAVAPTFRRSGDTLLENLISRPFGNDRGTPPWSKGTQLRFRCAPAGGRATKFFAASAA